VICLRAGLLAANAVVEIPVETYLRAFVKTGHHVGM
jgi:hypothetical protein